MLLRAAAVSDVPELVAVQERAAVAGLAHIFPPERYPFPRATVEAGWIAEIEGPDVDVFVVSRHGRLDGFAALRGDELLHFGTALDTWGSGLAAAMNGELLGRLAAAGHTAAWLRVFEQNHRARRFYEKVGWRPTPRSSRSTFPPYPLLVHYEIGLPSPSARPQPSP